MQVIEALKNAAKHDHNLIAERAIKGRELEIAVMGNRDKIITSPIGEIIAGAEFYDYDAKYNNSESQTIISPELPDGAAKKIADIAKKIFLATDGSGLARVDFFLEEGSDRVIFNEINTMPGFTGISMYPMLFSAAGMEVSEQIDRLIELALEEEIK